MIKVVLSVPNLLTIFRLFSVLPLTLLINSAIAHRFLYVLVLYCIVMSTDVLDGIIARKYEQESELGGFLDALSDKIVLYVVAFSLYRYGAYVYYVIIPMFVRDMIVDSARSFASRRVGSLPANWSGKLKFFLQNASVVLALFYLAFSKQQHVYVYISANVVLAFAFFVSLFGLKLIFQSLMDREEIV